MKYLVLVFLGGFVLCGIMDHCESFQVLVTTLNQHDYYDFVLKRDKMHPISIESERSPSSMYLKHFDNKNLLINLELAKIFNVEVILLHYVNISHLFTSTYCTARTTT